MLWLVRFLAFAFALLLIGVATALAAPGDLDPGFGDNGVTRIDFGGSDSAQAVLVQPDGKIVAAGDAGVAQDFFGARLNPDGSLDSGFGAGGRTTSTFGTRDNGFGAALQPDGKIVVAGGMTVEQNRNFAILRLTADGSPDPTFDDDGRDIIDYGGRDEAQDVVVQPDGQIVVAGSIFGFEFAAVRLNPDGEIEDQFGTKSVDFTGTDTDRAYAVALQPDGKILMAGTAVTGANSDIAVARLNADSSLDTSFDGDGRRTIDLGGYDTADDVLVQPDGKIVVAGTGFANSEIVVARLNPNGSLDSSFGGDGTASVDVGDSASAGAVALQASGKILVAGSGGARQPLLLRFQPGGALDTTFGGDGQQALPFPGGATSLALLDDGRIAVGGSSEGNAFVALVEGDSPASGGGGGGPGGGKSKVPRCAGKKATIVGTNKPDKLKGTRRADVIVALRGNDKIDGKGGNDTICAGDGNDSVKGGDGNDRLHGQNGSDKLDGGRGNDVLAGDAGKDGLAGGSGKDRLAGGGGKDNCSGGAGKDRASCERRHGI
jgi:uncharacterized delta-60 repeat protein